MEQFVVEGFVARHLAREGEAFDDAAIEIEELVFAELCQID